MLLPIKSDTQRASIFSALNQELLHFLNQACDADDFSQNLFSAPLGSIIWANEPTREKFDRLWRAFKRFSKSGRRALHTSLLQSQNLGNYHSNITLSPVRLPKRLSEAMGEVTSHLFGRTSRLTAIEGHCTQTLTRFFAHFCAKNKNVCCACGTEILAQYRADVVEAEQWRGPFDHILSREGYPGFAIHPDNLLPICCTCNSKAKLAKDVLHDSKGARRRSFNPYTESAHDMVGVKLVQTSTSLTARSFFQAPDSVSDEKLKTWDEVYCIRKRVDGWLLTLLVLIDTDCCPADLNSLRASIAERKDSYWTYVRHAPWNLWKHKLYTWLHAASPIHIDSLWAAIEAHRDDANFAQEFGI